MIRALLEQLFRRGGPLLGWVVTGHHECVQACVRFHVPYIELVDAHRILVPGHVRWQYLQLAVQVGHLGIVPLHLLVGVEQCRRKPGAIDTVVPWTSEHQLVGDHHGVIHLLLLRVLLLLICDRHNVQLLQGFYQAPSAVGGFPQGKQAHQDLASPFLGRVLFEQLHTTREGPVAGQPCVYIAQALGAKVGGGRWAVGNDQAVRCSE